ncbi:sensor histidine kinase [Nocardiopsis ansamitocini]|uniref:histidine kinase n=1 Tax=Nocardiopsis ansamitocini TaxID=1670832 RepID=A0A9W6P6X1_9ACTN|nr:nitrate- and nitrite sensing domain-containing protein [Nocardiopsis ansamitocini]GLU48142.1 histidine kinase [Nocardiopsis ansamitocini]
MGKPDGSVRSIRSQLNRVVLIPAVTFLLLFAVLSAATLMQAFALRSAGDDGRNGVFLYRAVVELQNERRLSVEYAADPSRATFELLRDQYVATDAAVAAIGSRGEQVDTAATDTVADLTDSFFDALHGRAALREEVSGGQADRAGGHERYSHIIDLAFALYDARARLFQDGASVASAATTLEALRTQEAFSRADALLSGARADGTLTTAEQTDFTGQFADVRQRLSQIVANLDESAIGHHDALTVSPDWSSLVGTAEAISSWAPRPPTPPAIGIDPEPEPVATIPSEAEDWRPVADTVNASLVLMADTQAEATIATTDAAGARSLSIAIGGGILALFAGALAYGAASKAAGRLTYRLGRLRQDTLDLSGTELPQIMHRLERGETIDLERQPRCLDYGTDEVGQVADAFNTAQRRAVGAAVKQAEIREGANRVFLAIAHRNQSLLQRQLHLLDRVEREEEDPDLLEDLFQLDHLATRGRRNAENLIILGGGQPGRRWRNPIPLVDILRGAISETEEYARVKLRVVPNLSLRGAVVADVIHLLAELVENAAAYSPPHTKVFIHSEIVPKGVVVEIEDRGLGISDEDLTQANITLSTTPEFDVMALTEDARLGLFVVARLSNKHDIRAQLCTSPYGGTRAVVLIPSALVVDPASPPSPTARSRPSVAKPGRGREDFPRIPDDIGDLFDQSRAGATRTPMRGGTAPGSRGSKPQAPKSESGDRRSPGSADFPGQARESGRPSPATSRNARPVGDPVPYNVTGPVDRSSATPSTDGRPALPTRHSGPVRPTQEGHDPRPELPRRRRQTHLAPQLREEQPTIAHQPAGSADARSPEEARTMMRAFQNGTRLGRASESEETPVHEPALNGSRRLEHGSGVSTPASQGPGRPVRPGDHSDKSE